MELNNEIEIREWIQDYNNYGKSPLEKRAYNLLKSCLND